MIDWQRKRHPEDVPTPVAVAVSDFCRRAKKPAPPALVRDALALLGDDDDFRVRALTDADPPARPLGPFAVVDIIRGTEASVAAQREETGYYEVVRTLVEEKARSAPAEPPAPEPERVVPFVAPQAPRPSELPAKAKRTKAESIADKIRPMRRSAGERVETPAPPPKALPGTAFLPKRNLPAPRGRFTQIDPERASYESLLRADARDTLAALVEQVPHRVALMRALDQGYAGRRGKPISLDDVENLLDRHELAATLARKERDTIIAAVLEQKGAAGRAAHALGMRDGELKHLVDELDLKRELAEIRERFSREALSPRNLALRLDLLPRSRYLEDLGIERKFRDALERDLSALVDEVKDGVTSVPDLVELLSRQHALHADSLRRALEKLGLLETWLTTKR